MSGGLLEKAKQASGDPDTDDVAAAADAVIASGSTATTSERPVLGLSKNAQGALGFGLFGLCLGYIVSLPYVDWPSFLGYGILVMIAISMFFASQFVQHAMNAGSPVSLVQWMAIIVSWIVLSSGAWVIGMESDSAGILLTDGQVHEDDNTVTLMLRHSSGTLFGSSWEGGNVDVSVTQDDTETWSGSINVMMNQEDMIGAYGLVTLQISDFYAASAIQVDGFTSEGLVNTVQHPYTVHVTLEGETASQVLPTLELTRDVDDVDEEAWGQVGDNNCEAGYTTCVEYVEIRGWVGMGVEGADEDTTPVRVRGDYTLDMSFGLLGDGSSIDQNPITVSGTEASWAAGDCAAGTMDIAVDTSAFMFKCNSQYQFSPDIALSDSSGEREYGCYALTLTATQAGQQVASSTSYYMFEQDSSSSEGNTYYSETFESTESC
tara:strand:- start:64 stop:1365 length:1302 start_codon:yes stop_codon:yes gene_type:complete